MIGLTKHRRLLKEKTKHSWTLPPASPGSETECWKGSDLTHEPPHVVGTPMGEEPLLQGVPGAASVMSLG